MVSDQAMQIESLSAQMAATDVAALEDTVDEVDSAIAEMSSCIAQAFGLVDTPTTEAPVETTALPTKTPTMMETTPTPTMMPTSLYSEMPDQHGYVCGSGSPPRTFKTNFRNAEDPTATCAQVCASDAECMYFSISGSTCIGCDEVPSVSNSHTGDYLSYEMNINIAGRRRLSEIESLRAENAALRELLKNEA